LWPFSFSSFVFIRTSNYFGSSLYSFIAKGYKWKNTRFQTYAQFDWVWRERDVLENKTPVLFTDVINFS